MIVVDDCSTDKSCAVVESYKEKFNGRMRLFHTEKNSGGGGYVPRNFGIHLSCGKYIFFVDSDDLLLDTALETLYTAAKKYNADVVYCEKYYEADDDGTNLRDQSYQKGGFVNKPTLETEDLKERVQRIINDRYLTVPWNKLIKRNLIVENEIFFPLTKTSEDNIWNQGLLFHAKKFLRVPNIVYIYRQSAGSAQRTERTSQEKINFWLNPVLLGLKYLDKMMSRHEFFKETPSSHYALLKNFVEKRFSWTKNSAKELDEEIIYSTIKEGFGERLGEYDVLIPALCTALYNKNKVIDDYKPVEQMIDKFRNYITARIDIKLISTAGDFKIISTTDKKARVEKPGWLNKGGIGYVIHSYVGKLEFVAKASVDGKIRLWLRGLDIRTPEDKFKRIPYWIDYTKLIINDKIIFDKITPAWHDKPYRYDFNAKADEEIKIQIEWLPHRSDV